MLSLLDTMVFYNGLYFALRSGKEHRSLRMNNSQIEVFEQPGERAYLKYTEDLSKNRQGGLKGRNVKPKIVYHHANQKNPKRCFVKIFKKYKQLCPDILEKNAFYLQPAIKKTLMCWYSPRPIGHDTLSKTLPRLCKSAGIQGFKTNHSLRATAATRLYRSGIDEQLVMERTGHRSLEGVRNYKRTSDQQRQVLSDVLNMDPRNNVPCAIATPCRSSLISVEEQNMVATFSSSSLVPVEEQNMVVSSSSSSLVPVEEQNMVASSSSSSLVPVEEQNMVASSSSSSLVSVGGQNIIAKPTAINTQSTTSRVQANTKNVLPGTFNFNSCSNVTVNINYDTK